jgi:teichuronic acid biosynthesis glycosyltransferase TuaC
VKVGVVTEYFPTSKTPWGGHSAYQTLRVLASRCDLQVFCPQPSYPALLRPKSQSAKPIDPNWNPPDVKATYIPYPALPVVTRPINGLAMANHLLPYVRRFQPDILLNYFIYPDGYAAVRIGRALNVPVVLTAIGSDLNRISDPLCVKLTRSALRQADYTITVSHDLAKTAATLGARSGKLKAILNGCDTGIFHPQDRTHIRELLGVDPAAEVVVFVGRLDVRKGLVELIDAVAALRGSRPKLHCYIVGDGPDRPLLVEAIARHDAGGSITLIPSCPTSEVVQWMAAGDLVTLPSYKEGCPNVVIEALAAGRPLVATNVGGIPELMDDTCGRLVPPTDVPALIRALDEVLSQTWDANAISSRHSRNWADVADDVYSIFEELLAARSNA